MNGARSHFFDLPAPDWGVQFAIPDGPMCNPTLGGAEKRRLSFKQDKRRLVQELGGGSARPAFCLKVTLALCPMATMALARKPPGPRSIFHFFPPKGGGRSGGIHLQMDNGFLVPRSPRRASRQVWRMGLFGSIPERPGHGDLPISCRRIRLVAAATDRGRK